MNKLLFLALTTILLSSTIICAIDVASEPIIEANGVDAWSMFRHDPRHSGFSASTAPNTNRTTAGLMWNSTTGDKICNSSAAVVDGVVFIGSSDGRVYAFHETNGSLKWKSESLGGKIYSSPAVAYGKVFVGCEWGNVTALNATTGEKLKSQKIGDYVYSSPAVTDDIVFIGSQNGTVYALYQADLSVKWKNYTGGGIKSSPAVADGMVFIGCTSPDRRICAFNKTNGWLIWKNSSIGPVSWSSPAVDNGLVFVGSTDSNIYVLNESNGNVIWLYPTGGPIYSSPAVADGKVYVGSNDYKLYCFNAMSGASIWNYSTGYWVVSSPAVADGKVFVGSHDSKLYALNATTGILMWNYKTGGKIDSSPAIADGWVFVGSWDSKVYAFGPNHKPIPSFTYSPEKPEVNEVITFNACKSYDPDSRDRIENYTWNFGDGNTTTVKSPIITHFYKIGKPYTVTLTITDTHGATNTTSPEPLTVYEHKVRILSVVPKNYTVALGEMANINVTVKNEGTYDETNLNVTAYYTGPLPYPTKTQIRPSKFVDLLQGESKTVVILWNTTAISLGNYTISATVTNGKKYDEKPDGTIGVMLRDLAIKDVTPTPSVVCYDFGENITIDVTVQNLGNWKYKEYFNVTVFYANATIEKRVGLPQNGALSKGESKAFKFDWNTTGLAVGNYRVIANVTIVPYDFNSTNNVLESFVQIRQPFYDINMTDVSVSDYYPLQGDIVHFDMTIKNIGDYEERVPVMLYVNGTKIGENETDPLATGSSVLLRFYWNTTLWNRGHYNITAFANVTDDRTLQNNNQTAWVTLRLPVHDVAAIDQQLSEDHIFPDQDVYIFVIVENIGNYNETFPVEVYANVTKIGEQNVKDLKPGSRRTMQFLWEMPQKGNYSIWAIASLVNDNNTRDNICTATRMLYVLPPIHDVAIHKVQPSTPDVLQNNPISINVIVQNQGAYSESANVTIYANSTKIWSKLVPFEREETKLLSPSWNTTGFSIGNYTISATIFIPNDNDPADNNFTDGTVEVILPTIHDVAVTDVDINILPWWRHCNYQWVVWQNCTWIMYVTVENKGHFDETFNLTIYADHDFRTIGDEYILSHTVVNLKIEEARNLTIYCDLRGVRVSSYWITASASPVLNETKLENNNLTIPEPPYWYGTVWVLKKGDLNGDGKVDMKDVGAVARDFGAELKPDGKYYRPTGEMTEKPCDVTGGETPPGFPSCGIPDGKVDMKDIGLVAREFGK